MKTLGIFFVSLIFAALVMLCAFGIASNPILAIGVVAFYCAWFKLQEAS